MKNNLLSLIANTLIKTDNSGNRITTTKYTNLGDGVYKAEAYSVPMTRFKKDRVSSLRALRKDNVSIKDAAKLCDMSDSYAHKLLK